MIAALDEFTQYYQLITQLRELTMILPTAAAQEVQRQRLEDDLHATMETQRSVRRDIQRLEAELAQYIAKEQQLYKAILVLYPDVRSTTHESKFTPVAHYNPYRGKWYASIEVQGVFAAIQFENDYDDPTPALEYAHRWIKAFLK